jgi:hypothetical protein
MENHYGLQRATPAAITEGTENMPLNFGASVGQTFHVDCTLNETAVESGHVFKAQIFKFNDNNTQMSEQLSLIEEHVAPAHFDFIATENGSYLFACYDITDHSVGYKVQQMPPKPEIPTEEVGERDGRQYDISVKSNQLMRALPPMDDLEFKGKVEAIDSTDLSAISMDISFMLNPHHIPLNTDISVTIKVSDMASSVGPIYHNKK